MRAFAMESQVFAPRHVLAWLLFTLSAGFVNASAFMACHDFVTHVTGNVTNIAVDRALARDFVLVIALFIGGAMFAVLVAETFKARPRVAYAMPLLGAFLMLLAVSVAGKAGYFGAFGTDHEVNERAFVMLGMLAVAMGIVNATLATATGNQVRITHLTGPATDLAGNLVRAALGGGEGSFAELRWAMLRFGKLVAFAVGAALAARYAAKLQYDLFAVAAGVLVVALGFTGAPIAVEAADASDTADDSPETSSPSRRSEPPPSLVPSARDDRDAQNAGDDRDAAA